MKRVIAIKVIRNLILAFSYGYIYAILFILCLGIFAAVTGNIMLLVTDIVQFHSQNFMIDLFRIFSIFLGFVGVFISQKLMLKSIDKKNNIQFLRRLNGIQLGLSLLLVVIFLIIKNMTSPLILLILVNMIFSLIMGIQVNNSDPKVGDLKYNNMACASNLQNLAKSISELIYQRLILKSENSVFEIKIYGLSVMATIVVLSLGVYCGSVMCKIYSMNAIDVLPGLFLLSFLITLVCKE